MGVLVPIEFPQHDQHLLDICGRVFFWLLSDTTSNSCTFYFTRLQYLQPLSCLGQQGQASCKLSCCRRKSALQVSLASQRIAPLQVEATSQKGAFDTLLLYHVLSMR
jgi:hypothetical protein